MEFKEVIQADNKYIPLLFNSTGYDARETK